MSRAVFVAVNEAQAQMVRDLLAARGIDVRLSGTWRASLRGMLPMTETSITIEVDTDEDADQARAALAELEETDRPSEAWACPRCGEEVPSGFDACWKCSATAEMPVANAGLLADRGAPPLLAGGDRLAEVVDEAPANDQKSLRELFWAIGAGCAPVAFTGLWFNRHRALFEWLTPAGRVGLLNLAVGIELVVCLWLLRRRGVNLSASWGGRERWFGDLVASFILAALLFVVEMVVYWTFRRLGAPSPGHARTDARPNSSSAKVLDTILLLLPGVGLAAGAGALLLYGVVLVRLRTLLRSPIAALILASLFATLTWCPFGGIAFFGAVFAEQLLLGGAFLLVGRAWPLAISTFVSYLLTWIPSLLRG